MKITKATIVVSTDSFHRPSVNGSTKIVQRCTAKYSTTPDGDPTAYGFATPEVAIKALRSFRHAIFTQGGAR